MEPVFSLLYSAQQNIIHILMVQMMKMDCHCNSFGRYILGNRFNV